MAVNAKPALSTITSPAEAVPEYPPAKVEEQATSNGMVLVKWGDGGAKQTSASAGTEYPSVFSVVDSDGLEPLVKTYGSLLGCDGGTLTIQGTTYRIQVARQQQQANGKKSLEDEARWTWTDVTATLIPDNKPTKGDFLDVRLPERTGLRSSRLYCREEMRELWDELNKWSAYPQPDQRSVIGHVSGPPGSGKTTTTFAWLQAHVKSTGKSASWLYVNENQVLYRAEFKRRSDGTVCYYEAEKETLKSAESRIKESSSAILVFDGYREKEGYSMVKTAAQLWAGSGSKKGQRTVIILSSYAHALSFRLEEKTDADTRKEEYMMPSWPKEVYIDSLLVDPLKRGREDPDFGQLVLKRRKVESTSSDTGSNTEAPEDADKETDPNSTATAPATTPTTGALGQLSEEDLEDIDEKFYYGGGNARFFYGFTIPQIKDEIWKAVEKLDKKNIGEVLAGGSQHQEARHRLLAFFKDDSDRGVRKEVVSQYAVKALVEHSGVHASVPLWGLH